MSQSTSSTGNPAPLGLLAFGMTTLMLMYVEMGWAEHDFEYVVAGYAIFFGGLGQVVVALLELIQHGSSFSFAVFFSYGAFWFGWSFGLVERAKDYSTFSEMTSYSTGMTLFFIQWGVLSTCFFIVTLRKNVCLILVFSLLASTFYLLAAATSVETLAVKKSAGYVGFATAIAALYTGIAELINEEWGRHVLPGLRPLHHPERTAITKEGIIKLTSYDKKSNSMFLQFSGLHIYRPEDIDAIRDGVQTAIINATPDASKDHKVHVIVDYRDVSIAKELEREYWNMTRYLERNYYLSVRRFYISSFGSRPTGHESTPLRDAALSKSQQSIDNDRNNGNGHTVIEDTVKLQEHEQSF